MRSTTSNARHRLGAMVPPMRKMVVEDRVAGLASEVAFWAVLSIVPAALVLASLLGALEPIVGADTVSRAETRVVDGLDDVFTDDGGGVVDAVSNLFAGPRPGLFSIGLVLILWTAGRVFAAIVNAFAVIGSSSRGATGTTRSDQDDRPWVVRRLLGVSLGLATLVVVSVLLALLVISPFASGRIQSAAVIMVALVLWVTTMYHLATRWPGRWLDRVPGALVALVLWGLFTLGLRVYLAFQGDNVVVQGLGGVLVVLLWSYLIALGLMLGGVVNVVAYDERHEHH
jgi:membrane protein